MREMIDKERILNILDAHKSRIKEFGVRKIGLFGSFVRNQASEDSDIDLLVEFEKGQKTFDNYMNLKFFLEELFGHKVDLVINESLRTELKPYIMEEIKYA